MSDSCEKTERAGNMWQREFRKGHETCDEKNHSICQFSSWKCKRIF
jgi:hypothetical protein